MFVRKTRPYGFQQIGILLTTGIQQILLTTRNTNIVVMTTWYWMKWWCDQCPSYSRKIANIYCATSFSISRRAEKLDISRKKCKLIIFMTIYDKTSLEIVYDWLKRGWFWCSLLSLFSTVFLILFYPLSSTFYTLSSSWYSLYSTHYHLSSSFFYR